MQSAWKAAEYAACCFYRCQLRNGSTHGHSCHDKLSTKLTFAVVVRGQVHDPNMITAYLFVTKGPPPLLCHCSFCPAVIWYRPLLTSTAASGRYLLRPIPSAVSRPQQASLIKEYSSAYSCAAVRKCALCCSLPQQLPGTVHAPAAHTPTCAAAECILSPCAFTPHLRLSTCCYPTTNQCTRQHQ